MNRTTRRIRNEQIVRRDAAQTRQAVRERMAGEAPYSYADLAAARRAGALVELLGQLDAYTLRCQALRFAMESPVAVSEDRAYDLFCRLLSEARFGRAA